MFAMTPDSIFKVESYAYTAVAISSATCGLGIACDIWFLVRYSWVDLEIFIVRTCATPTSSRTDIVAPSTVLEMYMVHTSFSPCPPACPPSAWLVSSISLMTFLGLIAYDAWPVGVLVISVLVVLVMFLEFVVYGAHRFVRSALYVCRAIADLMVKAVRDFRRLGDV